MRKIDPPAPSVERPWSHEERKPGVSRREEDTISRFPEAMESALAVRVVIFPLDEELGLVTGSLSPHLQEQLVHLATWMPFARAVQMLKRFSGAQISEASARRHSYQMGQAQQAVQESLPESQMSEAGESDPEEKVLVSPDGAMVPLVGGQWAEVKTVAIGKVERVGAKREVHSTHLSYFSRMEAAQTFTEHATGEMLRRGVDQAEVVGAVMDGAEWIDGFLQEQCQHALRILDFAHAAEYVSEIGQLAQAAGSVLPSDWLPVQLHKLKHHGPTDVLQEVRQLRELHPEEEAFAQKVAYLEKREARMQYPQYQAAGWPIGSGMVESGNKVVMQARMKGAGMHWEPAHVNPMLALRNSACNDCWDEAITSARTFLSQQRLHSRRLHQQQRYEDRVRSLLTGVLRWKLCSTSPTPTNAPPSRPKGSSRPSATHPWRKPFLAKK